MVCHLSCQVWYSPINVGTVAAGDFPWPRSTVGCGVNASPRRVILLGGLFSLTDNKINYWCGSGAGGGVVGGVAGHTGRERHGIRHRLLVRVCLGTGGTEGVRDTTAVFCLSGSTKQRALVWYHRGL
jgi:hypothetical protein